MDVSENAIAVGGLNRGYEGRGVRSRGAVGRIERKCLPFIAGTELHFESLLESGNRRAIARRVSRTIGDRFWNLRYSEVHPRQVVDNERFVERTHDDKIITFANFICVALVRQGKRSDNTRHNRKSNEL